MKNESDKLISVIKESLYRITKKGLTFTPFNYYKIFTETAFEYGMDEETLHKFLYGNVDIEEESIKQMKQKILEIARDVKDVTVGIQDSIKKTEDQHDDVLEAIVSLNADENMTKNITNEIEKIKYINMSLKSELEAAKNILEKQKESIDSLKELSLKDYLTGLYLRRYMDRVLDDALYNFKRYSKPFSIIMLDLDDFKKINDIYGHAAGDVVLKDFARLLNKITRYTDSCIRYGGDEFVVVLPETKIEEAEIVAKKIQTSLDSVTFKKANMEFKCSVSIGITGAKENDTLESILERVDEALYRTKRDGKSGITIL